MKKDKGVTLIEIVLVVVVIAILSLIAVPNYIKAKGRTTQREAVANLQLIAAEEKIYYIENSDYANCNCVNATDCAAAAGCNSLLRLILNTQDWGYGVVVSGASGSRVANITATAKSSSCVYTLTSTDYNVKNFSTSSDCIS